MGQTREEVLQQVGKPYEVEDLGQGRVQIEYLERVDMDGEILYFNHYYLIFEEGRLVEKRMERQKASPFDSIYRVDPYQPFSPNN